MPSLNRANWRVHYEWSAASGLRLGVCEYQGVRVIQSASVPFVYVNYEGNSSGPFTDQLKSRKAKVEVRDIMFGFDLKVTYDYYGEDYEYEHVWRFHDDGQFGSTIVIQGPGEEIDGHHTYHVPFRYDLDVSGASGDSFQQRRAGGGWTDVPFEGQHFPMQPWAPDFDWRVIDKATGRSAAIRGRAGDRAELWALRYRAIESWGSWGAAGSGVPGSPGSVPALYANGQSVQNADIVVWYIAHVSSVDRVTACGPWFRLQAYPEPERPGEPDEHGDHHHDDGGHH